MMLRGQSFFRLMLGMKNEKNSSMITVMQLLRKTRAIEMIRNFFTVVYKFTILDEFSASESLILPPT